MCLSHVLSTSKCPYLAPYPRNVALISRRVRERVYLSLVASERESVLFSRRVREQVYYLPLLPMPDVFSSGRVSLPTLFSSWPLFRSPLWNLAGRFGQLLEGSRRVRNVQGVLSAFCSSRCQSSSRPGACPSRRSSRPGRSAGLRSGIQWDVSASF